MTILRWKRLRIFEASCLLCMSFVVYLISHRTHLTEESTAMMENRARTNATLSQPQSRSEDTATTCPSSSHSVEQFEGMIMPNQHVALDFLFEGPGLQAIQQSQNPDNNTSANPIIATACRFRRDNYSGHLPHAMQQVYRCVSWWQWQAEQKQKSQQGMSSSSSSTANYEPYFIVPPGPATGTFENTAFLKGFLQAIRGAFGVRVVRYNGGGQLKGVRPIVDYGYDQRHDDNQSHSTNEANHRGYQTRTLHDLKIMRNRILQREQFPRNRKGGCPVVHSNNTAASLYATEQEEIERQLPVVAILNRQPQNGRTIPNVELLQKAIHDELGYLINGIPQIVYFEGYDFSQQIQFMSQTDILLSPHGAQLTSIPFLPDCASVTEFFPAGYDFPEFFASLAAVSNVTYHSLYTGRHRAAEVAQGMKTLSSREAARSGSCCPDVNLVVDHVRERMKAWYQCCSEKS